MADNQVTSNGNTNVYLILANGIADYKAPTAEEIAAGLNITNAIAWEGTTFPTASDSEDQEDRSLMDRGNASSRGADQYEATLALFYPKDNQDMESLYGKVYNLLRVPRVPLYIVTKVLQGTEGTPTNAVAGDWVSVYRFLSDGWSDNVEGDTSKKYVINMLTQGDVAIYTQVKNASAIEVTNASGSDSIGVAEHAVLRATMGGKPATQAVSWKSSNPAVASVSPNGVVTGVSVGTAEITASHAAATPSTALMITVASL